MQRCATSKWQIWGLNLAECSSIVGPLNHCVMPPLNRCVFIRMCFVPVCTVGFIKLIDHSHGCRMGACKDTKMGSLFPCRNNKVAINYMKTLHLFDT